MRVEAMHDLDSLERAFDHCRDQCEAIDREIDALVAEPIGQTIEAREEQLRRCIDLTARKGAASLRFAVSGRVIERWKRQQERPDTSPQFAEDARSARTGRFSTWLLLRR